MLLGQLSSLLFSPTLRHIIDLLFNSMSININSILYIPGLMQVVLEKYITKNGSIVCLFSQICMKQVLRVRHCANPQAVGSCWAGDYSLDYFGICEVDGTYADLRIFWR